MQAVKQFNADYVDKQLEKIGARVKTPVSIYLIGGCAMSFRQLKESTKDVDIVFRNKSEYSIFCDALFGAQYFQPFAIESEYEKLEATKMYENADGFHLDLFVKKVIGKLELSNTMTERAELFKKYGKMTVFLIAKEDIFLFKALASEGRERDLPDMLAIYPRLDWQVMEKEVKSQKLREDLTQLLSRRLQKFRETYRIDVPLLNKL